MHEIASVGCERELWLFAAERLEPFQRTRVRQWVLRFTDGEVVTAELSLLPQSVRHPVHRGVEEERGLNRRLDEVHEVVVATDVGQLVGEHHP